MKKIGFVITLTILLAGFLSTSAVAFSITNEVTSDGNVYDFAYTYTLEWCAEDPRTNVFNLYLIPSTTEYEVMQTATGWELPAGYPKDFDQPIANDELDPDAEIYGSLISWRYGEGPQYVPAGVYVFQLESNLGPGEASYAIFSAAAYKGYIRGPAPVPEPATMLLIGSGLIGLTGFRRRFRKN